MDWKWLFIYPGEGVATVNRLVVPAGQPVHLSLTSATVMQSILMPRLAGQIYAMAGMRTQLNFAADAPGSYLGENVQFNGMGFQDQKFTVDAMDATGFDPVARAGPGAAEPAGRRRNTRRCLAAPCSRRRSPSGRSIPACSNTCSTKPNRAATRSICRSWVRRRPRCRWKPRPMITEIPRHRPPPVGQSHLGGAAVRACLARPEPVGDHRRRRRRDGVAGRGGRVRAGHLARQVALSLDRVVHQPRSQEDRHHVHRARRR